MRNGKDAPIPAIQWTAIEPRESTQSGRSIDGRFVPTPDLSRCSNVPEQSCGLLDHLVRAFEQQWRHGEAERFSCLEIDAEVETRRLLEWQVRRLGSLKNAINQIGRAIVNFIQVGTIGRQTAFAYIVCPLVGGRQPMFSSKFVDPSAIEASECIRDHENCVRGIPHHACESLVKIFRLTHAEWLHPNPNCPCGVCGSLVS